MSEVRSQQLSSSEWNVDQSRHVLLVKQLREAAAAAQIQRAVFKKNNNLCSRCWNLLLYVVL